MNKIRKQISPKTSSQVLIANRHACCICQKTQVHLHHIDENPSNNDLDNLAVLCLEHHDNASKKGSLTRKLKPDDVIHYKREWEEKCRADIEALSRDRTRFYATVYKNPPRIRELFSSLSKQQRELASERVKINLQQDSSLQNDDKGFKWQAVPCFNDLTVDLLQSLESGELFPNSLIEINGKEFKFDYATNFSSYNEMVSYHHYDLYCQLIVRVLCIIRPPILLEMLWSLKDAFLIDHYSGSLVSFRETAIGKSLTLPKQSDEHSIGRIQFRVQKDNVVCRAIMNIKNKYIFSDTAALNLQRSRVCGIGIIEDAQEIKKSGKKEIHIGIKPLIIGIGGLGQSENGFWNLEKGKKGSDSI